MVHLEISNRIFQYFSSEKSVNVYSVDYNSAVSVEWSRGVRRKKSMFFCPLSKIMSGQISRGDFP